VHAGRRESADQKHAAADAKRRKRASQIIDEKDKAARRGAR
jgi:hypothetical protein